MAKINGIRFPTTWKTEECAGLEWFRLFMKRRPSLSIKSPESCSLSRATSFNRHNIGQFYKNLEKIFLKSPQSAYPSRIFNLDETATTNVQKRCSKVVGAKGMKQVNQATRAEKKSLVTTCCIICANGTFLPPAMVFPRVRFQKRMLKSSPVRTLGLAGKTDEDFLSSVVSDRLDPAFSRPCTSNHLDPALDKSCLSVFAPQGNEDAITSDEEPVNEPSTTVTKRGKGTASGERGGRGRLCRGRDTLGRSDSAQPTAVAIRRRQFIISFGESLVEPLIRKHLDNSVRLRKSIMDAIQLLELDLGERRIKIPTKEKRTQDVVICARACVTGKLNKKSFFRYSNTIFGVRIDKLCKNLGTSGQAECHLVAHHLVYTFHEH
ncbi:hypothetical protein HELRODRAFT_173085 [Helobdella robusta]|uniref:HTH CENPB-type domain-containing protein n=1 Tax=Helobdella robusta TaxID=6412 RepID=T1F6B5_HELRO|nr:hypothetical protein HELRODRAFT_173085 [Helobdella robusta]ESO04017.1 hypothetical protein HELRODRAFT_173085 [Helobdella robusta]